MNTKVVVFCASLVSLGTGASAGYYFALSKLRTAYEDQLAKEIADAKAYYQDLYSSEDGEKKFPKKPTLNRLVEELGYGSSSIENVVDEEGDIPVDLSEITDSGDEGDFSEEIAARTREAPYIISVDEYMAGEMNFEQATLTYYVMDGVLADDSDVMVDDIEATVGGANLRRFGHRSGNIKTLYVRNELGHMDFEIVLDGRSYSEVVAGIIPEEKPPKKGRRRANN